MLAQRQLNSVLAVVLFTLMSFRRRGVAMCGGEKRKVPPAFLQRGPADGDPSHVRCHVRHLQQLQAPQAFPCTQTGRITTLTTAQLRGSLNGAFCCFSWWLGGWALSSV